MSIEREIEELNELIRCDRDAMTAYDSAIDDVHQPLVKRPLIELRGDHERHVRDLSALVRQLGGEPVSAPGIRGVVRKTMARAAGLGGAELTLAAMRSNEQLLNKTYARLLALDFPAATKEVIARHHGDEQRHLAWVERALQSRLWEVGPQHPLV